MLRVMFTDEAHCDAGLQGQREEQGRDAGGTPRASRLSLWGHRVHPPAKVC